MIKITIIDPPIGMNPIQQFESIQHLQNWLKNQNETFKFNEAIWDGNSIIQDGKIIGVCE